MPLIIANDRTKEIVIKGFINKAHHNSTSLHYFFKELCKLSDK